MSALFDHETLRTPRPRPWQRLGFQQLFDGWQLGLLAVVMPLLTLWVVLPRPVTRARLPLPEPDRRALASALEQDRERAARVVCSEESDCADSALSRRLPFAVRRVGERVRRFGSASAAEAPERLRELQSDFRSALAEGGAEPLLTLRALETELFLEAVRRFAATGRPDQDLRELSGNFAEKSRAARWLREDGTLLLDETELRTLYRVRWTGLVGAQRDPEFSPSLAELRLYYRSLLEHPEGNTPFEQDQARLALVRALGQRDAEYPAALARGILLLRLGQTGKAANALTEHLADRPDGPYALSARNYLLGALAEGRAGE